MPRTVAGIGREVHQLRRNQNLTQAELARRAGVSRDWLIRLEQGHHRLEAGKVLDVLHALGYEVTLTPRVVQDTTAFDEIFERLNETPELT